MFGISACLIVCGLFLPFQSLLAHEKHLSDNREKLSPAVAVIGVLLEAEDFSVRTATRRAIRSLGLQSLPLIQQLSHSTKSPETKDLVNSMLVKLRELVIDKALQPDNAFFANFRKILSSNSKFLNRMRLGISNKGDLMIWFPARALSDPARKRSLEFLVMPKGSKRGYECLSVMTQADWISFSKLIRSGFRELILQWKSPKEVTRQHRLKEVMPWAEATVERELLGGLRIGGNHDETKNKQLPADDSDFEIGVLVPGKGTQFAKPGKGNLKKPPKKIINNDPPSKPGK